MSSPASELARRAALGQAGTQAFLFYGAPGSDVLESAQLLARAMLCRGAGERPCGACPACTGRAVDLLEVFPRGASRIIIVRAIADVDPKNKEDAELIPARIFLRTPPLASPKKVVLIHEAERMNVSAASALLKILEEPPPYAVFILATTEMSALPETIRSRCLSAAAFLPPGRDGLEEIGLPPEVRSEVESAMEALLRSGRAAALRSSQRILEAARALGADSGMNARQAQAGVMGAAAAWVMRRRPDAPRAAQAAAEACGAILGNAGASITIDAALIEIAKELEPGGRPRA